MIRLLFACALFLLASGPAMSQTKTFALSDTIFSAGAIYKPPCDIIFSLDGRSYIDDRSKPCLDTFAQFLLEHPGITIEICAHTDQRGVDSLNVKLSQQRANEVKRYLESKGVPAWNMAAVGYGETQPVHKQADIVKLKTKEEQELQYQANRRIEFRILRSVLTFTVRDSVLTPGAYLVNNMKYALARPDIDSTCFPFLDSLAALLLSDTSIYLRVMVHVDIRSSDNGAHSLGSGRVEAIEAYLLKKGVPADRGSFVNYGKVPPVVPLASINAAPGKEGKEALHAVNRRTEFRYMFRPIQIK